jgi:hypothetical protein
MSVRRRPPSSVNDAPIDAAQLVKLSRLAARRLHDASIGRDIRVSAISQLETNASSLQFLSALCMI